MRLSDYGLGLKVIYYSPLWANNFTFENGSPIFWEKGTMATLTYHGESIIELRVEKKPCVKRFRCSRKDAPSKISFYCSKSGIHIKEVSFQTLSKFDIRKMFLKYGEELVLFVNNPPQGMLNIITKLIRP